MKTLYFDCFAGASGNMILGALVSLGVDSSYLINELKKLNISDFDIEFSTINRSGISSIHAKTLYNEEKPHRHFSEVKNIIENSQLSEQIKNRSIAVFKKLAEAEARVHGIDLEAVHFHEVGAMDAILDVVGACIGFDVLEIEEFTVSKIHVGSGFVDIAHGKYPVPPPAVAELLNGFSVYSNEIEGELITPTGAAIIATLCDSSNEMSSFIPQKTGYGAGTREYTNFPNALRLILGESSYGINLADNTEKLLLIETNLDDVSSEVLGFLMDKVFEVGALDCWFTSIQMKKNRPATMVSILCNPTEKEKIVELLYNETTTLGVRIGETNREFLARKIRSVKTEFGEVEVKIAMYKNRMVNIKPEYEDVKNIANKWGKSFKETYEKVIKEVSKKIEEEQFVR